MFTFTLPDGQRTTAPVWSSLVAVCLLAGCQSRPANEEGIPVGSNPTSTAYSKADARGVAAPTGREEAPATAEVVATKEIVESFANESVQRRYGVKVLADGREVKDGEFVEFYDDGQEFMVGSYRDGQRWGEWKFYFPDGTLAKTGAYGPHGQPNEEWTVFNADGRKRRHECYLHGRRDGTWVVYAANAENIIKQMSYRQGKLHGTVTEWYPNGQKAMESEYNAGSLHGTRRRWYENGDPLTVENFQQGKKHGKSTSWSPSGSVAAEVEFRDGLRVSHHADPESDK